MRAHVLIALALALAAAAALPLPARAAAPGARGPARAAGTPPPPRARGAQPQETCQELNMPARKQWLEFDGEGETGAAAGGRAGRRRRAPGRACTQVTFPQPAPLVGPPCLTPGYCGEASLQMSALFFGAWISQFAARAAGGGPQVRWEGWGWERAAPGACAAPPACRAACRRTRRSTDPEASPPPPPPSAPPAGRRPAAAAAHEGWPGRPRRRRLGAKPPAGRRWVRAAAGLVTLCCCRRAARRGPASARASHCVLWPLSPLPAPSDALKLDVQWFPSASGSQTQAVLDWTKQHLLRSRPVIWGVFISDCSPAAGECWDK
jgi:hypothetical protein